MNIIAVDDENAALWALERAIKKIVPDSNIACFISANEALDYAKDNQVDVSFLDIEMNEMNGLMLAKELKDIYGETNIIFVTGYSNYMESAYRMYVSGYVMKPIDAERVEEELENLRKPVQPLTSHIQVQCFGNFDIFVDGKPLEFSRQKTKELLAYLVARNGVWCDVKEIAAVLWEDKVDTAGIQSHLRTLSADLAKVLNSVKANEILLKKRGMMAIDPKKFDCDMYRFINGDLNAINGYKGEFMAQYSWAEFMNAYFEKK